MTFLKEYDLKNTSSFNTNAVDGLWNFLRKGILEESQDVAKYQLWVDFSSYEIDS